MLDLDKNGKFLVTHGEVIKDEKVKNAYRYLIGWSATKLDIISYPTEGPVIKDFQFYCGQEYYFAFIPNKKWLLFYFRKPCQVEEKFSVASILNVFPSANTNNKGEVTLRVTSLEEAVKVAKYIDS